MDNKETAMSAAKAIVNRTVSVLALATYLKPRLAMDAKPAGIIAQVFDGVTGKNFKEQRPVIAKRIKTLYKPLLAKDASLEDVEKVLDMLDGHEIDGGDESVSKEQHNAMEAAAHGHSTLDIPKKVGEEFAEADKGKTFDEAGFRSFLAGHGMGDDAINEACAMLPQDRAAKDEFPPKKEDEEEKEGEDEDLEAKDSEESKEEAEDPKGPKGKDRAAKDADMKAKDSVSKPAMDAAIKLAKDSVRKEVIAAQQAIRQAERDVAPYVGTIDMAFDSAEHVYREALMILGVPEAKTIHESALKTVLSMQPKAGAKPVIRETLGMDAKAVSDFNTRFPDAARIGSV